MLEFSYFPPHPACDRATARFIASRAVYIPEANCPSHFSIRPFPAKTPAHIPAFSAVNDRDRKTRSHSFFSSLHGILIAFLNVGFDHTFQRRWTCASPQMRNPIARAIKKDIRKGPAFPVLPLMIRTRAMIRQQAAAASMN